MSPERISNANGMIARPPNCSIVPSQMKGTRFQPSTERWLSDRNPTSARKGANSNGRASIEATIQEGTASSTIMTRLSVPISSTAAMPTVTWNSDSRSSRDIGNSSVAASANGRIDGPNFISPLTMAALARFISGEPPKLARCRSRAKCAGRGRSASLRVRGANARDARACFAKSARSPASDCHGGTADQPHA